MKNIQAIKYSPLAIFIFVGLIFFYYFFFAPPKDFPINSTISIKSGSALTGISRDLKIGHVVRSEPALQFFAILFGGDKHIVAGDYFFDRPIAVWNVAYRISLGKYHQKALKVTILEGSNVEDMAAMLSGLLSNFNKEDFLVKASLKEGYLFPDTYFFYPTMTAEEIIKILSDNFWSQIAPFQSDIKKSGKTLEEIIIMASLIEKESGGPDD